VTLTPSIAIVIGIGNAFRSDDGVGLWVARKIREQLPDSVSVLEATGEVTALLEAWEGAAFVILVDAVRSGAAPGTIHRLDAPAERVSSIFCSGSTHSFGVGEAIELARALNRLPPRLIVYGIDGGNFGPGVELSPVVVRSAAEVAERILSEARSWAPKVPM
jgi:hydrogenase maturation protease